MDAVIQKIDAFEATGDELEDVSTLSDLSFEIEDADAFADAAPAVLRLFERYPKHSFGSPGPMVFMFENLEVNQFIDALVESLERQPSTMSLKLLREVLGGAMSQEQYARLLEVTRGLAQKPDIDAAFKAELEAILAQHGA